MSVEADYGESEGGTTETTQPTESSEEGSENDTLADLAASFEFLYKRQNQEGWDVSQWNFQIRTMDTITRCLEVVTTLARRAKEKLRERESRVRAREEVVRDAEDRLLRRDELHNWQVRLCADYARLEVRRREFDQHTLERLREFSHRYTLWEEDLEAALRSPDYEP